MAAKLLNKIAFVMGNDELHFIHSESSSFGNVIAE